MAFQPPQIIFGLLVLSNAMVLIVDISYNQSGNYENDL